MGHDHRRPGPDVYLSVPTSSPSCTYSASCRGLSPQCLTDRPRLRREDRPGGQAARSGQAREGAASDADVAGNASVVGRQATDQ